MSYPLKSFITDFFLLEKNNCILISSKIEKLARRDAEREMVRWSTIYWWFTTSSREINLLKIPGETTQYYHRKELIHLFQLHLDIRLDYFLLITIGLLNQIAVRTLRLMLTMYFACTRATGHYHNCDMWFYNGCLGSQKIKCRGRQLTEKHLNNAFLLRQK